MNKKIIFLEDDADLRENIVEYLSLEGFSVTGVGSALDFFQTLGTMQFDVAIVDLGLPDRSGFEVVAHLRTHTKLGIIILTARDTMKDKIKGYESGADSYFVKPVNSRELVASINNLLKRLSPRVNGTSPLKEQEHWALDMQNWVLVSPVGRAVELTTKELNLLQLLIAEQGSPVTRDTLLVALGYHLDGPYGNRALDVLVTRLRKKIKIQTEETPIKTVHSVGYSFSAPIV